MYKTKVTGAALFQATAAGYGQPIATFGSTQKGETPVSLVNVALAACVTMCVQGYYASQENNQTMPVEVESQLEDGQFELSIGLGEKVSPDKQARILAYIDQKCNVKNLLREDLPLQMTFRVLESVK